MGANAWSAITVDPAGSYVYVTHSDENTVSQYAIGTGGELAPL
mgnify:CR=1 FL=1